MPKSREADDFEIVHNDWTSNWDLPPVSGAWVSLEEKNQPIEPELHK